MTNAKVRKWYLAEVAKIHELDRELESSGVSLETRARAAWGRRAVLRREARNKMSSKVAVKLLQLRDIVVHGTPNGPTFHRVLKRAEKNLGLTGDAAYLKIIQDSTKTDKRATKWAFGKDAPN